MSRVYVLVAALLSTVAPALAQGEQTGGLSGRVSSADALPLPGVTVTVMSSALQGPRSAVSDVNGVYVLRGLPPGPYSVRFELSGLTTAERKVDVALGSITTVDQARTLAPLTESVEVRGATPPAVTTPAGATNMRLADAQPLPVGRTPFLIAELAPGLTDNTPNQTQVTIGGGFAYDNVFLMDGVDINDNVLGQPNNLFIEEGLDEVQVLTSGIGAEYGRFGGGVVNVVTKSGGNIFSGAFRTNLANASWSRETPLEVRNHVTRPSKLSAVYEGVAGGPIVRDRAWFFGATRVERTTSAGLFQQTNIPYTSSNHNQRYEGKATGTIRPGHTLQGTFIDNATDLVQPSLAASIEPRTMTTPSTANRLGVATWHGVLGARLFATAQYSQKIWNLKNAGNSSTDIHESPFLTRGLTGMPGGLQYNAPYFDSTDPETRNNRQLTATLSYQIGRRRLGSHELKTGFEHFVATRKTGNSQTSTGYVFQTDYKIDASGAPVLDASGRLIPRFIPGSTRMQTWMPVRGAVIDMTTASAFATDRWTVTPRLTADVGLRYEHASSDATNQTQKVSTGILMPRLAASYALTADGRTVAQATFGLYTGTYNDVQFSRNSSAGNADRITGSYTGPAGEGVDFAAGFDPNNYSTIAGTFPTVNVFFDPKLTAPHMREATLALGRDLGRGAWARATYVHRRATDFVEDFITIADGKTTVIKNGVNFGTFDNAVYRNTDLGTRDYDGIQLQSAWTARRNLSVAGQWTVQLENDGNFEGEAANLPAIPSLIGDYPELYVPGRNFPTGRVDDFQRSKVRVWASYGVDFGRAGRLDLAPLYRYNSARTFSYTTTVALSAAQLANNPGYARVPTSQTLFFGERGDGTFAGYGLVDFAATWTVPVWQSLRPWFKVEVLNAANNQKAIGWDTTVTANNAGAKDEFGLPLEYIAGPNFGKTTKNSDYPRPRPGMDGGRTFLMSFGLRF
jgi:Carboxypeptidase regulatory-like domain